MTSLLSELQALEVELHHPGVRCSRERLEQLRGVVIPEGVEARVTVVEPTGAETELLLDVAGTQLVVVMHGRTHARPDDRVHVSVEPSAVHAFDGASGRRLG